MAHRTRRQWTNVIVERTINDPLSEDDAYLPPNDMLCCSDLFQVEWLESMIGVNRDRLICHFRAPDAESVRAALRNKGTDFESLWAGTLCASGSPNACDLAVDYQFESPRPKSTREALSTVINECLRPQDLELTRAIISRDRSRAICVCETNNKRLPADARAWSFMQVTARRQEK